MEIINSLNLLFFFFFFFFFFTSRAGEGISEP